MVQRLKKYRPHIIFTLLVIGIASRINLQQPLDLHTLVLRDIDEDAFQISIDRMRQGWSALDPMRSFSFGFYAYGRLFWLIPGILGYGFHIAGNETAIIFIPRLVSTLFGLMSVICVYETLRFRLSKGQSCIGAAFLLIMLGFWKNTFRFHPDHMMTAFSLLGMYFFAKDKTDFGKRFWRGCVAVGVSLASKLAAIIFIPVIAIYLVYGRIIKKISFAKMVKYGFTSLGCIALMYIVLNPYVLHPIGFNAIKTQFFIDMYSNATNHGGDPTSVTPASIYDHVIQKYYVGREVLALLMVLALIGTYREIYVRSERPVVLLILCWLLIAGVYMLTAIHKEWQHYYLFPAMFLPILFLALNGYTVRTQRTLLSILFIMQGLQQFPYLTTEFSTYLALTQTQKYQDAVRIAHDAEDIVKTLVTMPEQGGTSIVVPNELPLDYASLGIKTQNVRKLYGNLTKEMVEGYKDSTRNVFFQTPDLIVLTKDLPLLDRTKEDDYKKTVTYPDLLASRKFYGEMISGAIYTYGKASYSYSIVRETPDVIVLKKVLK